MPTAFDALQHFFTAFEIFGISFGQKKQKIKSSWVTLIIVLMITGFMILMTFLSYVYTVASILVFSANGNYYLAFYLGVIRIGTIILTYVILLLIDNCHCCRLRSSPNQLRRSTKSENSMLEIIIACIMAIGKFFYRTVEATYVAFGIEMMVNSFKLLIAHFENNRGDFLTRYNSFQYMLSWSNFFFMITWRIWINKTSNNHLISSMRQTHFDENTAKLAYKKITNLLIKLFSTVPAICLYHQIFVSEEPFQLLNFSQYFNSFASLNIIIFKCFPNLIACCFLISICDVVSVRLEKIENEIKDAKSPYRAMRKIKSSIKEFENLEKMCKSVNYVFSIVVFFSFFVNIMPSARVVGEIFTVKEIYKLTNFRSMYDYFESFIMILCNIACLKSFLKANSKKRLIMSAIRDQAIMKCPINLTHMASVYQTFDWAFKAMELVGITKGHPLKSQEPKFWKLRRLLAFLGHLCMADSAIKVGCMVGAICRSLGTDEKAISLRKEMIPFLPFFCYSTGYLILYFWKIWINQTDQISQLISSMKRFKVEENCTNTINEKMKKTVKIFLMIRLFVTIVVILAVIVVIIYDVYLTAQTDNRPLKILFEIFCYVNAVVLFFSFTIISSLELLMPFVCYSIQNIISDFVSSELDKIINTLRVTNSPYRARKIILKSIERYEKLEMLSKATNDVFNIPLFLSYFTYSVMVAPLLYYMFNMNIGNVIQLLCTTAYETTVLYFLFVKVMISAAQVNRKKNTFIWAMSAHMSKMRQIPPEMFNVSYN
ncbi:hypothetical protein CHUAL_008538 [Chamberlinius hualienensis]